MEDRYQYLVLPPSDPKHYRAKAFQNFVEEKGILLHVLNPAMYGCVQLLGRIMDSSHPMGFELSRKLTNDEVISLSRTSKGYRIINAKFLLQGINDIREAVGLNKKPETLEDFLK